MLRFGHSGAAPEDPSFLSVAQSFRARAATRFAVRAPSTPLNFSPQVNPIKTMFNAPVQPLTGRQPHGVLFVRENGDLGGGFTSGAAKDGMTPLTREIIEIADCGEDFLLAHAAFVRMFLSAGPTTMATLARAA